MLKAKKAVITGAIEGLSHEAARDKLEALGVTVT